MILVKAQPRVQYGKYSTRGEVKRQIQHLAMPHAVFAMRPTQVLYFLYSMIMQYFNWFIVLCGRVPVNCVCSYSVFASFFVVKLGKKLSPKPDCEK